MQSAISVLHDLPDHPGTLPVLDDECFRFLILIVVFGKSDNGILLELRALIACGLELSQSGEILHALFKFTSSWLENYDVSEAAHGVIDKR